MRPMCHVRQPASSAEAIQPLYLVGRHHAATLPLELDCYRAQANWRRRKYQHVRHAPLESSGLEPAPHCRVALAFVGCVAP